MRGKGLNTENIALAALELVKEKGYGNYGLRDLAERLNVRAASLYNHVNGVNDINREIGRLASLEMNRVLACAGEGKTRDEALAAMGRAYRDFARREPELYQAILSMPKLDEDKIAIEMGRESFRALADAIGNYDISREVSVHFTRCYRSALHGFVAQQKAGYYSSASVDPEQTFDFMIDGFIQWINRLEAQSQGHS